MNQSHVVLDNTIRTRQPVNNSAKADRQGKNLAAAQRKCVMANKARVPL